MRCALWQLRCPWARTYTFERKSNLAARATVRTVRKNRCLWRASPIQQGTRTRTGHLLTTRSYIQRAWRHCLAPHGRLREWCAHLKIRLFRRRRCFWARERFPQESETPHRSSQTHGRAAKMPQRSVLSPAALTGVERTALTSRQAAPHARMATP